MAPSNLEGNISEQKGLFKVRRGNYLPRFAHCAQLFLVTAT